MIICSKLKLQSNHNNGDMNVLCSIDEKNCPKDKFFPFDKLIIERVKIWHNKDNIERLRHSRSQLSKICIHL